jgi:hypothetical protein
MEKMRDLQGQQVRLFTYSSVLALHLRDNFALFIFQQTFANLSAYHGVNEHQL